VRQLDRREPDAAGPGVDQHPLAGLQPGQIERECGSGEGHRNGRERRRRHPLRRRRHELAPGHDFRSERAERKANHPVAHGNAGDLRSRLDDPAAHLAAEQSGIERSGRPQHVAEIEPRRLDRDPNLSWLEPVRWRRLYSQAVQGSALVGRKAPAGLVGERDPRRCGPGSDEARDMPPAAPEGDVILRTGEQQLLGKLRPLRRLFGIEIDHPRAELQRFSRHCLAEAPQRRAGDLAIAFALQRLGAPGDEPQALRGRSACVQNPLHH